MRNTIIILVIYSLAVTIKLIETRNKYRIAYNNYRQSLKALAECDPDLARYLAAEE